MRFIEHFIDGVIRFRWLVILATVAACVGLASGMSRLQFANDYHVFFGPNNPELLQLAPGPTRRRTALVALG